MKRTYTLVVIDQDGKEILRKKYKYIMALSNYKKRKYGKVKFEISLKENETIYTINL